MIKKNKKYETVQIDAVIKDQLQDYCNRKGLKMGRFLENLFLGAVSGTVTGSAR